MVLSGSQAVLFANTDWRLGYTWSATQNVANNASSVTVTLYIESLKSWAVINDNSASPTSISINGNVKSFNAYSTTSAYQKKTLGSHTVSVPHNADGTKTFNITCKHFWDINWASTGHQTPTVAQNWALNNIARASSMSVNLATVEYGKSVTISISRAAASFKHIVRYAWGGSTGNIATNVDTSVAWTVPLTFMNLIPAATASWGTIYVDTYSGSTLIGTASKRLDTTVPATVVPSYSALTISEGNSAVPPVVGVGNYVQGLSNLQATLTGAVGAYGSLIRTYSLTIQGKVYQSASNVVSVTQTDYNGTIPVVGTVTDSRGRTSSKTINLVFLPYQPPSVTGTALRTSGGGGISASITRVGKISILGSKNTFRTSVRWKEVGASVWSAEQWINTGATEAFNYSNTSGNVFPSDKSFDIELSITDKFNTITLILGLTVATAAMSWGRDGVGVGKVHERGALDVMGASYFDGEITTNKPIVNQGFVPMYVSSNTDLNNLKEVGFYYNKANAEAATMLNYPTEYSPKYAFSLLVEKHAGIKQTLTVYTNENPVTMVRNMYSNTWGEWVLIGGYSIWKTLPLRNSSKGYARIRKAGGDVYFEFFLEQGAYVIGTTTASIICDIPEGYRTLNPFTHISGSGHINGYASVRFDINGEVKIWSTTSGASSLSNSYTVNGSLSWSIG